ncbi:hypothetical protein [Spiroplasma endosymbiont of Panorpa germanica]|uniref:hypothetical protein n=1 Tax=Spiroplasma endosymbiont of Panorpa germanica TaxID=3066314 RepID=UPI0030D04747
MSDENMMKNISKIVFDDFFWITNFFPIHDQVYFTDSNFNNGINLLLKIEKKILVEEVKIKKPFGRYFLAHPTMKHTTAIGASQTDLKICLKSSDFIQNIIFHDFGYLITFVNKTDEQTTTYTNKYNGEFELIDSIKMLENKTIISPILNENLVFTKNNSTGEVFQLDLSTENTIEIKEKIKKVCELQNNLVILTDDFKVLISDKNYENIEVYEDSIFEKQIAAFSEEAFLLSDKENGKTYCSFLNESKTKKPLAGKYFYRLDSFNRELIIAKPLVDRFGNINYYQAPWFIY